MGLKYGESISTPILFLLADPAAGVAHGLKNVRTMNAGREGVNLEHTLVYRSLTVVLVMVFITIFSKTSYAQSFAVPRAVVSDTGEICDLAAVNDVIPQDGLVMFTPDFGGSTLTLPLVYEIVVRKGKVESIGAGGNTVIPKDGFVLATFDPSISYMFAKGDSINIRLRDDAEKGWSTSHAINGTNTVRNTDNLIVYTPKYPKKSTGTNEYGIEAVVSDDRVIAVQGNNNQIPANGYVISGHGAAQTWLQDNLKPGARIGVSDDRKTLTVTVDTSSYIAEAKRIANQLPQEKSGTDCTQLISKAEAAFSTGDVRQALGYALNALDIGRPALMHSYSSMPREYRGFWYRMSEASPEDIAITLDRLSEANANVLFLETFYDGRTIYPSNLTEQLPQFEGWDPLAVWVEEAHKRHIQIHAWMHISNVGESGPGPILEQHPEWTALQKDGSMNPSSEPGLYYADLAIPAFQNYMSSLIRETLKRYALDGIELDYIRYPSGEGDSAFSYSEYSRAAFKTVNNADPIVLTAKDKLWKAWGDWRREQISGFVKRIRTELKQSYPGVLLSAAVFSDSASARNIVMQDWSRWLDEGLLDFVSPMLYSKDTFWVTDSARKTLVRTKGNTAEVPGLGYFMGFTSTEIADQITGLRNTGCQGSLLFSLGAARGGILGALKAGLWSRPAEPPLGIKW